MLLDVRRQQSVDVDVGCVLAGHDDGVETHRPPFGVLDGDLGLAVGPQVGNGAVLSHGGQPAREPVRKRDRQRHELRGLGARVAEHQALVTRALTVERVVRAVLALLVGVVDALGNVRGL